eukprot:9488936-Pyramimonas_sp.AAC.1
MNSRKASGELAIDTLEVATAPKAFECRIGAFSNAEEGACPSRTSRRAAEVPPGHVCQSRD